MQKMMLSLIQSGAGLVLLLVRPITCQSTTTECYNKISDIMYHESKVIDFSHQREYTLCEGSENDITSGQNNAIRLEPNLQIKCGKSGLNSGNCIVRSGDVQVVGTNRFKSSSDNDDDIIDSCNSIVLNAILSGITFIGANLHSVWIDRPGNVHFEDCTFKVCAVYVVISCSKD